MIKLDIIKQEQFNAITKRVDNGAILKLGSTEKNFITASLKDVNGEHFQAYGTNISRTLAILGNKILDNEQVIPEVTPIDKSKINDAILKKGYALKIAKEPAEYKGYIFEIIDPSNYIQATIIAPKFDEGLEITDLYATCRMEI